MNFKKSTTAIIAAALGVSLIATTALADIITGSGYIGVKNAIKSTSKYLAKEAQSYTLDMSLAFKEGDRTIYKAESAAKLDRAAQKSEERSIEYENGTLTYNNTHYSDSTTDASRYKYKDGEEHFYVTKYEQNKNIDIYDTDIFEEEEVLADVEKLADAFVGSLQNLIQVSENNGERLYTANVDSSQLPVYINALGSFILKYSLFQEYQLEEYNLPTIKNDIGISAASAKMTVNSDGVILDCVAEADFSGKDENGINHDFSCELLFECSDINSTVVETPDMTGAEITYAKTSGEAAEVYNPLTDFEPGTYTAPITERTQNGTVKIGEYCLELTEVNDEYASGSYSVTYTDGKEHGNSIAFDFETLTDEDLRKNHPYEIFFEYTDKNGEKQYGRMDHSYDSNTISLDLCLEFLENGGTRIHDDYGFGCNFLRREF